MKYHCKGYVHSATTTEVGSGECNVCAHLHCCSNSKRTRRGIGLSAFCRAMTLLLRHHKPCLSHGSWSKGACQKPKEPCTESECSGALHWRQKGAPEWGTTTPSAKYCITSASTLPRSAASLFRYGAIQKPRTWHPYVGADTHRNIETEIASLALSGL